MRVKLASAVDLTDTGAVVRAVDSTGRHDLTLSSLATKLNADKPSQLLDPAWVKNTALELVSRVEIARGSFEFYLRKK